MPQAAIKMVRNSAGRNVRNIEDILKAFRDVWLPLFTHEGGELMDDINNMERERASTSMRRDSRKRED